MEITVSCKDDKIEKEILYKNGRKERFLYYKCRNLIICRDLNKTGTPLISTYPSMRTLINRLKKWREEDKEEFDQDNIFLYS